MTACLIFRTLYSACLVTGRQVTKFMEKAMTKAEARTYIQNLGPQGRAELLRDVGAEKIMQIMMPGGRNSVTTT
jgi:hypothetical protein